MKRTMFFSLGMILAALSSGTVFAQSHGAGLSRPGSRGVNPGVSLSAPATSPLQAQVQDDYASQLGAEQRDLMQQNPSGLTRQELSVGHALNGFTPR